MKDVTIELVVNKLKHYNGAFSKRPISRYNFDTKEWTDNKNPICWYGGLFEYKDNILTGRYFSICLLQQHDINKGWMPKPIKIQKLLYLKMVDLLVILV